MRPMTRRMFSLGALTAAATSALKAEPSTMRIVFPFPAGGSADGIVRSIADRVAAKLQRAVIVENRTGAGGKIGALAVKDAPPDGSVLLVAAAAQMYLQPHAFSNLGYNPFSDFVPICQLMTFSQALAISSQVPADSLPSLFDWLRQDPSRGLFGSPGAGTGAHFAGAELARLTRMPLGHVAYRGTPAGLPDLIAGRVPMFFASAAEFAEQHRAKTVRIVGLLDHDRSANWPGVPTFREAGYDITVPSWFSVHAPAQTPPAIVSSLEAMFSEVVSEPLIAERMRTLGFAPTGLGASKLLDALKSEHSRWRAIVSASGFRAEL